jgi:hypothetical protein
MSGETLLTPKKVIIFIHVTISDKEPNLLYHTKVGGALYINVSKLKYEV